jgi:hypothetical protein
MTQRNPPSSSSHTPPSESQAVEGCEDGCFFCTGPETD